VKDGFEAPPPNDILLTVSGVIDPQIEAKTARGERPQADYVAMARGFPADLIDYPAARKLGGRIGRLLEKIGGPNLTLAWACFSQRRKYRVLFTDGEQVGLLLAFLLKFAAWGSRPRHCMIAHRLSVKKKMIFLDWLGVHSHIDIFITYSTWQESFIRSRWKLPDWRVVFTPFMVDTCFFSPGPVHQASRPLALEGHNGRVISAVGLEYRDYPTLIEAVRGLPLQVVLAAASPWSKRRDTTAGSQIPNNVLVRRFTQFELRELYAASQFVVMPLYPVDFQAGVTAILEAMAMGKAVICTRTPGQTDVIIEGETGLYVEPGDPRSMRSAIEWLFEHPEEAERMGRNSRQRIEQEMSLDRYVHRLVDFMASLPADK
jgi:glycosyltransferase involved in cell wall biosynthesis